MKTCADMEKDEKGVCSHLWGMEDICRACKNTKPCTRKAHRYLFEMSNIDHRELVSILIEYPAPKD